MVYNWNHVKTEIDEVYRVIQQDIGQLVMSMAEVGFFLLHF